MYKYPILCFPPNNCKICNKYLNVFFINYIFYQKYFNNYKIQKTKEKKHITFEIYPEEDMNKNNVFLNIKLIIEI